MTESVPSDPPVPPTNIPTPADGDASSASTLEEQLAAAQQEAASNHERYLRTVADLENFRKRMVRDKEDLRQYASARVMEELLPVIDNLALGLAAAKAPNADLAGLVGGISMVETQLKAALANHGLKEINPAGQSFDPNLHEALSQQPSSELAEGVVMQVIRTGYSLNGRLLRPAAVVVSSGSGKEENA